MFRVRPLVPLLTAAALAVASMTLAAAETNPVRRTPAASVAAAEGRVIVKYRTNASVLGSSNSSNSARALGTAVDTGPQLAQAMGNRLGLTLSDGRAIAARTQVVKSAVLDSRSLAAKLAADSDVEWAVVDQRRFATTAPNDPLYAGSQTSTTPVVGQWYLRAPSGEVKSSLDIETAWNVTQGSTSVVVAVLDTGVRKDHPDLTSKLLDGYDFVSDSDTANDGGGRDADASDPGDWITTSENTAGVFKDCGVSNSSWHGTAVSSLVGAATNNGVGMAGVAPNVKILPVRVLGKCGGYDSDIIAGMRWSAGFSVAGVPTNANPARVLNLSLGSSGACSAAYQDAVTAVTAAGVVVVAASGNEGLAVGVPANCSGVISVAGVRHTGTKVGFSNLGPENSIAAPAGNCVNATGACLYPLIAATNTGTTVPSTNSYFTSFAYELGTSFASPLVAGTAALMISANSSLTPSDVKALMRSTARAFPTTGADAGVGTCQAPSATAQDSECYCTTSTCGAGLLNAGAAVVAAAPQTPTVAMVLSATVVSQGSSVTIDASGSSAVSGSTISSYAWSITNGSSAAQFTTGTTGSSVSLLGTGVGSVTVSLTVTDSQGRTSTDTRSFSVTAPSPTAAFTVSNATPAIGSTVALDASTSTAGSGQTLSTYQWLVTTGTNLASFQGATNAAQASLKFTNSGTVVVQLVVTNSAGVTSSTSKTLTVSAAPVASFSLSDTAPQVGDSIGLDASASRADTGLTVQGYEWTLTAGNTLANFVGSSTNPTATLQFTGTGTVTLQLTVTDSAGVATSVSRTLTVTAASSSSGGGGGGAMAPWWAAGLALLGLALGRPRRR
ncbi:S8 family peptidase [Ideonella margarita]|uniref:S8 family serine peptidase n=1 Tax=Ideonella margarita TaxID=2984191 RepID=A0ABU9C6I1_9BURK